MFQDAFSAVDAFNRDFPDEKIPALRSDMAYALARHRSAIALWEHCAQYGHDYLLSRDNMLSAVEMDNPGVKEIARQLGGRKSFRNASGGEGEEYYTLGALLSAMWVQADEALARIESKLKTAEKRP